MTILARALVFLTLLAIAPWASAQQSRLDPDAILRAIVHVRVTALADARSNATLGREREGTGIVIDRDGHIVTIGYLIIEPDAIEVTTADGKTFPARPAGYDHATGFGLLKVQGQFGAPPIAFGESGKTAEREPVLVLPFGGTEAATRARIVSRRTFTGSWEYLLEQAIFTSPPSMRWAGAALVNRDGQLLGIGSLLVRDSERQGEPQPGNMFVPIDALKPILGDLIAKGKRDGPPRPWLGLATEELQGRLVVVRVSPGSPAERAGLRRGDFIVSVGEAAVRNHAELYNRLWALGPAGVDVPLRVMQGADTREVRVRSIDRVEYFREKPGT